MSKAYEVFVVLSLLVGAYMGGFVTSVVVYLPYIVEGKHQLEQQELVEDVPGGAPPALVK